METKIQEKVNYTTSITNNPLPPKIKSQKEKINHVTVFIKHDAYVNDIYKASIL